VIRKYYVKVNRCERRGKRGRGYNIGLLEVGATEYNLGHKHGSKVNVRKVETRVQIANRCAPWCAEPCFSGAAISLNGYLPPIADGASISHYRNNESLVEG
jgi:hypothetical protein